MGEAFTFKGRVAVVTGAAQGIGFHSAKKLCENGMKVAFVDLNEEKVKQMAAAAAEAGGEAVGIACDVSDESSIEAMITQVAELFGTVDVVVNCAGNSFLPPIREHACWIGSFARRIISRASSLQGAWYMAI